MHDNTMFEPNVTSVSQAAREKRCTRQAIYNAIERGDLNTVSVGQLTLIAKDEKYESYQVQRTGGRLHKRYVEKQTHKDQEV